MFKGKKVIIMVAGIAVFAATATVLATNDDIGRILNLKSIKSGEERVSNLDVTNDDKNKVKQYVTKLLPNKVFSDKEIKVKNVKNEVVNLDEIHYYTDDFIVKLDSKTKEFVGFVNNNSNFEKSTLSDKEVKNVLNEIVDSLDIKDKEKYTLDDITKFDNEIYTCIYSKKYNGLKNSGETLKISFAPMSKEIVTLNINSIPFDNNYVKIKEEDALKCAKSKIDESGKKVKKVELEIVRPNHNFAKYKENESYQFVDKMRLAYVVTLENNSQIYVDATTGEIIGGQITKEC